MGLHIITREWSFPPDTAHARYRLIKATLLNECWDISRVYWRGAQIPAINSHLPWVCLTWRRPTTISRWSVFSARRLMSNCGIPELRLVAEHLVAFARVYFTVPLACVISVKEWSYRIETQVLCSTSKMHRENDANVSNRRLTLTNHVTMRWH